MPDEQLGQPLTAEQLAAYVWQNAAAVQMTQHDHAQAMESVREVTYRGHRIIIRTTYLIEVDGVPITGHLAVTNDGRVHYHAIPNLALESAVDVVKLLIDTFPDDFPLPGDERVCGHELSHGHSHGDKHTTGHAPGEEH